MKDFSRKSTKKIAAWVFNWVGYEDRLRDGISYDLLQYKETIQS
jgi:hypothetical protein